MQRSELLGKAKEALLERRELDAKMLVAAAITELARTEGIRPVVTGGTSVDFWAAESVEGGATSFGAWRPSIDIDLGFLAADGVGDAIRLRRLLHQGGFTPVSGPPSKLGIEGERGWRAPGVPVPVEIIGHTFHGDKAKIVEVEVEGVVTYMRGPEDTLFEHVEWAAHTKDQRSWTRALAVAAAQRERLDVPYLRRLAKERGYSDALERCLRGEPLE